MSVKRLLPGDDSYVGGPITTRIWTGASEVQGQLTLVERLRDPRSKGQEGMRWEASAEIESLRAALVLSRQFTDDAVQFGLDAEVVKE